jgi:hypothetical protein
LGEGYTIVYRTRCHGWVANHIINIVYLKSRTY